MKTLDRHEFTGMELDWLATDQDGLIAFISTAGAGPVPESALRIGSALQGIYERILELPTIGEAVYCLG